MTAKKSNTKTCGKTDEQILEDVKLFENKVAELADEIDLDPYGFITALRRLMVGSIILLSDGKDDALAKLFALTQTSVADVDSCFDVPDGAALN